MALPERNNVSILKANCLFTLEIYFLLIKKWRRNPMPKSTNEIVEEARKKRDTGNYKESMESYEEALKTIDESKEMDFANLNTEIGLFLDELSHSKEALDFHKKALELYEKLGNPQNTADGHYNLCISLINSEQAEEAITQAESALKLYESQKNEAAIADCLYALGLAYNLVEDSENAMTYLKKAIKSYKKMDQIEGVSSALLDLGNLFLDDDKFDLAVKQFKAAEKIFVLQQDKGGIGDTKTCIARVFDAKEDTPRSSTYYAEAAESYFDAELYKLAKDNIEIVEKTLMSLPKATRKRLRNKVWDLKAKLPKEEK